MYTACNNKRNFEIGTTRKEAFRVLVKNLVSEVQVPGGHIPAPLLLALGLWASSLIFLASLFSICQMEITIVPASQGSLYGLNKIIRVKYIAWQN